MNNIDKLINELCPNGVEYKEVDQIALSTFWLMPATPIYQNDGIPYITSKNIKNGKIDFTDVKYISKGDFIKISTNRPINKNDVLITMIGTIGEVAIVENNINFYGQNIYLIRLNENIINIKFFYYLLTKNSVKNKLIYKKNTSSQGYIKAENLKKLLIPLPPLKVQKQIVYILDTFFELTEELTEELTVRKKQYEYYRDDLLSFKNRNVPIVKLKDIATEMYRGTGIKRDEVFKMGVPCVRYGEIYTSYNTYFDKCISHTNLKYISNPKYFEYGDILFAITGESVEDIAKSIAYIGNEKCLAGGDIIVMKHNQNPKYLSYVLSTYDAKKQKSKGKIKSKVVHTSVASIENIIIPLPSLEEQERIVSILDKFEKLCNDLTEGLPAEIEYRKKQYEYYRDKLLSFDEL